MKTVAALLSLALATAPAATAAAEDSPPDPALIVAMAQHFVQERFMFGAAVHHHVEFDVAHLHPQPEPHYWAVVGGFVSDQSTFNTYVAAVRLVCSDHSDVACWQLEKLAINGEVRLDRGEPL